MNYELFYKNYKLGKINFIDSNFPNHYGAFTPIPLPLNLELNYIQDYIQFSIKADSLFEKNQKDWEALICLEESKYITLIESEDWYLKDLSKEKIQIQIPDFLSNDRIIWRWG